ncbi:MAG TPA: hypothetical protein VL098_07820 [Flavipsychrobacter sp.]|nr:hypothetical protein [Flavipsychrobacter sp.]
MSNKKTILLALAILPLLLYGCYNDNSEDLYPSNTGTCDTAAVTYTAVIKPIMDAKCATSGCHLGASATGYDLSTHAGLATVAGNGRLIPAIEHTGSNPMPQGSAKLDDCTIAKIKKWVNDGSLNN